MRKQEVARLRQMADTFARCSIARHVMRLTDEIATRVAARVAADPDLTETNRRLRAAGGSVKQALVIPARKLLGTLNTMP